MHSAKGQGRATSPGRRGLFALLGFAVLVFLALLGLQVLLSYQANLREAATKTRNYAGMLTARLDATLRRADAILQRLAGSLPPAALERQAAPRFARGIDAELDAHLVNFEEVAGLRVFDAAGDLLYTWARERTPEASIADRSHFRKLRDDPGAGLVFSEVITSRATGRKSLVAARALRDGRGAFAGVAIAVIELDYFQRLFESLETGRRGLVSIRRSDDFTLVVRWPPMDGELNKAIPPQNPIRAAISAGKAEGTVEFTAVTDGVPRIFSFGRLERYPFYVAVALARDDVLAGWRKRSLAVAVAGLLALSLVAGLLVSLWRSGEREARAAADLAESARRLREAQEVAGLGSYVLDIGTGAWESSELLDAIFGIDAGFERSVEGWASLVHPEDRQATMEYFTGEVVGRRRRFDREYRIVRPRDGAVRWVHGVGRLELDGQGAPVAMIGTIQDVTERKRAQEALQESEERFQLALRGANDGLWDWNISTDAVYYSPRWKSMLGYGEGELEPHLDTWKRLVHPDDRERTLDAVRSLLEGRSETFEVEFRMQHKDGSYRHILSRAFLFERSGDGLRRLVGTHVDITERKLAESRLRESERFIRNILDTVDEGFIVVDRDYRILTANKAYGDLVTVPRGEVIGARCHDVTHHSDRPCFETGGECAVRRVFETGEAAAAVHRHRGRDGQVLFVETKAYPVRDEAGTVTSAIETLTNITERHLLEEERLKTQKLESIGTLAGGIAHDFNNLLQGIFGYIAVAKLSRDQPERSLAMIEQAEKALHQAVSLTTQLLTFSRGGKPVRAPIALGPVIENAVRFALSGSRSECRLALEPGLWRVDADAGQIGQVIQNVALNADQAMPHGGTVEIAARNVPPDDPDLPPGLARGGYVVVTIRDTGVGIPEQDLERIFDPYFTTKERGSGLGLATSYSIVRNHEGRLFAGSEVGKGSTFFLYLPATAAAAAAQQREGAAAGTRAGRILVMDDEAIIRDVARELLTALGHSVEVADRGEAAIEAFREAQEAGCPFDLVVLDLTIRGGMGGVETVGRLRELDPGVRAVASSGYSEDAALSDHREKGFVAFLKKPYNLNELQAVLGALLA